MYVCMYVYIRTYIHTRIHTYIHTDGDVSIHVKGGEGLKTAKGKLIAPCVLDVDTDKWRTGMPAYMHIHTY